MYRFIDFPHSDSCSCIVCTGSDLPPILDNHYEYDAPAGRIRIQIETVSWTVDGREYINYRTYVNGQPSHSGSCSIYTWNRGVKMYKKQESSHED